MSEHRRQLAAMVEADRGTQSRSAFVEKILEGQALSLSLCYAVLLTHAAFTLPLSLLELELQLRRQPHLA